MNKIPTKFRPIMVKTELKDLMDTTIGRIGKKMTYSQLILFLITEYEIKRKNG